MRDELADRIRKLIGANPLVTETRMFGGLCFMLNGNMQICVRGNGDLLARVGATAAEAALKRPGVERMVMRGREMADYLNVSTDQIDDEALKHWLALTGAYVGTLPPKKK